MSPRLRLPPGAARRTPRIRVALTGGIACGKSTVAQMLRNAGFPVCDADNLAHNLMRRGRPVFRKVVRAFGSRILGENGEIDRTQLGAVVFSDPAARLRLNALTHPAVRRARDAWLRNTLRTHRVAIVVIPLLFEAGMDRGWDAIVCLSAKREVVLRRLRDRGLPREAALQRIRAQWPVRKKERLSNLVLHNNGSMRTLSSQVRRLIEALDKGCVPGHPLKGK